MSSHERQRKSPYFYVRKGGSFVLLENHEETGTRYKTEAEAKKAVLALNNAWRAKHGSRVKHGSRAKPAKSNPRPPLRRNFFGLFKSAPPVYKVTAFNRDGSKETASAQTARGLEDALDEVGIKEGAIQRLAARAQTEDNVDSSGDVFKRQKDAYGWYRVVIEVVGPREQKNPRRRNPAASGEAELILWARPKGQTDALYEQPIYTVGRTMEDIERVKKLAAKDGWHTFRVQRIDLSKPYNPQEEFARTVRGSRRRNPMQLSETERLQDAAYQREIRQLEEAYAHAVREGKEGAAALASQAIDRETEEWYEVRRERMERYLKSQPPRKTVPARGETGGGWDFTQTQNPRKYDESRDNAGFRKVSNLKKGEYFKRKPDARKVYRKGDYDRSERKYAGLDTDDISRTIMLKGDALVYVGFEY